MDHASARRFRERAIVAYQLPAGLRDARAVVRVVAAVGDKGDKVLGVSRPDSERRDKVSGRGK